VTLHPSLRELTAGVAVAAALVAAGVLLDRGLDELTAPAGRRALDPRGGGSHREPSRRLPLDGRLPAESSGAGGPGEARAAPLPGATPETAAEAVTDLARRRLRIPVLGVAAEELRDSFPDPRSGGRRHRALDIPAPRGTPVVAVEDARLLAKRENRLGGLALFLVDASGTYCYYYAHLDAYASGLEEGEPVARGQVLGSVGTTGNAPESAPHLHFAISILPASGRCSGGVPVNPYLVLSAAARGAEGGELAK
jgi:murein DD-endopeptidase MepM/ murein hydrolase activator NlpD